MAQEVSLTDSEISELLDRIKRLWHKKRKQGKDYKQKGADVSVDCKANHRTSPCDECKNPTYVDRGSTEEQTVHEQINVAEGILKRQQENFPETLKWAKDGFQITDWEDDSWKDKPRQVSQSDKTIEELVNLKTDYNDLMSKYEEQRKFNTDLINRIKDCEEKVDNLRGKVDGLVGGR